MKKKQTVLIVDDIADNLNIAANTLIPNNINVLLAQSGEEAIKTTINHLPDLILLDIMMPKMNGFDVCSHLKNNKQTKHIPIIFLTAVGEAKNIVKGFDIGAVDYIAKPFFEPELIARVQTHLTLSQMQKEKEQENIILEQKVNKRTLQLQKLNKELIKNNKKLKKAKAKAEESDRLKTAFLNNISHEIRTPLNGIIGFSNLLSMPNITLEKQKSFTETIIKSSNKLEEIVSDIIAISSIQVKQEKLIKDNYEINNFMLKIVDSFKEKANEKNIKLSVKQNSANPNLIVNTDGPKLKQIIKKLIDNAIKYTDKGQIECAYTLKDETVEFYIKDTGIGIASKMHDKIFEQFMQLELDMTKTYGGTGLGLSIAKAYVNLLGGEIWLESKPGIGSVFYFNIPNKSED